MSNTPPFCCLTALCSKAASRTPDSPVEWELLGNEMQLLNDISSLLNLRVTERDSAGVLASERGEMSGEVEKREIAQENHVRWTSRQKVGRPLAASPLEGSSS